MKEKDILATIFGNITWDDPVFGAVAKKHYLLLTSSEGRDMPEYVPYIDHGFVRFREGR